MSHSFSSLFLKKIIEDFQSGKKKKSYQDLSIFIKNNPNDNLARYNFALMAQTIGLIEVAKDNYKKVIQSDSKNWQAQFNLYILNIQDKEYESALLLVNKVLALKKDYQPALRDKALILTYLNKLDDALIYSLKSIKINKLDYIAINILGLIYLNMKLIDKAIFEFEKAIKLNSKYIASYNNLSTCYSKKFNFEKTEEILKYALSLDPELLETINNIANVYNQKGMYDKAIKFYTKALKKSKFKSDILYNIGVAYFYKKKFNISEEYYKKAYKLNPNNDVLKKNYALLLLAKQKYKEGWSLYDGRLNHNDFLFKNSTLENVKKKLWDNQSLNKNSKILIIKEQGIGDEILFSSMYPDLLRKFPNCLIETESRLLNLFDSSFKNNKNFIKYRSISNHNKSLEKFDYVLYAGSLGKMFRPSLDSFPKNKYLKNPNKLSENSREIFQLNTDKIKIGISWTSKSLVGKDKSLLLDELKPILSISDKFYFINMQYQDSKDEINIFEKNNKIKINQFSDIDMYNDFDSLASILSHIDLFITVSNSTAHLAAALGVETWIIKPKNHAVFHYWNQPSSTTPWYNSVTLYPFEEKWSLTIENIKKDLIKKFT